MSSADLTKRLFLLGSASLALGGCFTPLYGTSSQTPANGSVASRMAQIEVSRIGGRNGVIMRNDLALALSGDGGGPSGTPLYKLDVSPSFSTTPVFVDVNGGRPTVQSVTGTAKFTLRDAEGKIIRSGETFSSTSIDRSSQRYAAERALIDAQERVAKTMADQIVTQIAAWLATGA